MLHTFMQDVCMKRRDVMSYVTVIKIFVAY